MAERDPEQAYFWTPEWQEQERIAEEEIRRGDVLTFESIEELLSNLHQEAAGEGEARDG